MTTLKKAFLTGILGCLGLLVQAQTTSSGGVGIWDAHHYLWFTGHWNKSGNKLTFIIDKGNPGVPGTNPSGAPAPGAPPTGAPGTNPSGATPGAPATNPPGAPGTDPSDPSDPPGNPSVGGTITFNADGTTSFNNSNVDAWNKRIDQALGDEQKYLQGLQNPGDNLDPTTNRLHQLLLPDAQQRVDDAKNLKIDPNSDMLGSGDKPSQPAPGRTLAGVVAEACQILKPDYDEVMNYYTSQVKNHKNNLPYPKPPTVDYNCYSCDSNLRKQNDTAVRHYARDFAKEEIDLIKKGRSILQALGNTSMDLNTVSYDEEISALFLKNKQDPSKSGACSAIDVYGLCTAINDMAYHVFRRAVKMVEDNKTNYAAATAITLTYNQIERSWTCYSGTGANDYIHGLLVKLVDGDVQQYIDKFVHSDWRQIGNIPYVLNLIRAASLFGERDDTQGETFYTYLEKLINSFKLTVDMDIKIGANGGYKLAHLKGQCHIIPSFQQDENQCYKWVIADENRQELGIDGHGFYMAKELQNFDATLQAAQVVAPGAMPKYTGTKKYTVHLASLAMDFCHPGNDTINLTGFTANPPEAGTWTWPNGVVSTEGVIGMEQYFEDINNKKKFAKDGEAKKAKDDLHTQTEQLKTQMEALKAQMTASQGNTPPGANFEKMMELKNQALSKVAAPIMAKLVYLYFLLPVQNNNPVLVDHRFDAKQINPQEANAIVYGYYTIHIENTITSAPPKPGAPASPKK